MIKLYEIPCDVIMSIEADSAQDARIIAHRLLNNIDECKRAWPHFARDIKEVSCNKTHMEAEK